MRRARWQTAGAAIFVLLGIRGGLPLDAVPVEPLPPPAAAAMEIRRLADENPTAGDLAARAEAALASGQVERAVELYREAAAAAPRSGWSTAGSASCSRLGQRDPALAACRLAVQRGASVPDLRAMVGAIVSAPRLLTVDEVAEARVLASGARRSLPGEPHGYAALPTSPGRSTSGRCAGHRPKWTDLRPILRDAASARARAASVSLAAGGRRGRPAAGGPRRRVAGVAWGAGVAERGDRVPGAATRRVR